MKTPPTDARPQRGKTGTQKYKESRRNHQNVRRVYGTTNAIPALFKNHTSPNVGDEEAGAAPATGLA
jgi:hypothetical protein